MNVFEVNNIDYTTADAAIAAVEAVGTGSVVKFVVEPNLHGCLPKFVHRSCAMWTFEDGVWYAYYIFGPGMRGHRERPQ